MTRDRLEEIINEWMVERIYGSAISRATDAYNHLYENLPDLADRIEMEMIAQG